MVEKISTQQGKNKTGKTYNDVLKIIKGVQRGETYRPLQPGTLNCSMERQLFLEKKKKKEIGNHVVYTAVLIYSIYYSRSDIS